jgi:hypothetical protein
MALDRTWYNALVDDDGSNTVGTVWNKAQIKNLLDSVDAEFLKAAVTSGVWTPVILATGGASGQAYSIQRGVWHRVGNMVHAQGYVVLSLKGTIAGNVVIAGLPFYSDYTANTFAVGSVWAHTLATTWAYLIAQMAPANTGVFLQGSNVPAANTGTSLTGADLLDASQFMVTITYRAQA